MRNFIKSLNSIENSAMRFIKASFNITFCAYFVMLVQYYIHSKDGLVSGLRLIYYRQTLEYIFACFILSLSFGLLIDLLIKKSK